MAHFGHPFVTMPYRPAGRGQQGEGWFGDAVRWVGKNIKPSQIAKAANWVGVPYADDAAKGLEAIGQGKGRGKGRQPKQFVPPGPGFVINGFKGPRGMGRPKRKAAGKRKAKK